MSEIRCPQCGAQSPADAMFCATCGTGLPGASTPPGLDPGPESPRDISAEQVRPPQFGETGPPVVSGPTEPRPPIAQVPVTPPPDATVPPASSSAAPTTSMPAPTPPYGVTVPNPAAQRSEFVAARPGGMRRSTSAMIAALSVVAVVIVGGLFVLLLSGGDDDETGDSIADPAVSEVVTTIAPLEATTVAATAPPTAAPTTLDAGTSTVTTLPSPPTTLAPPPPTTLAPPPQVTAALPPAPTLAPVPSTVAPPLEPIRGPGDLGLAQPILNEPCDGRYITFVGSAIGERPYPEVVSELLALYPGTNYIWTRACPSLRQEFTDGSEIYGVVFGPYATVEEACDARRAGPLDSYVRRISTTDPEDHQIDC